MITNSAFNIRMSLFKFFEAQSLSFDMFFHDMVKLSPKLQQKLVSLSMYGYAYIRILPATPDQETVLTVHVLNKSIDDAGTQTWTEKALSEVHDALRLNRIPFINAEAYISNWPAFMASASHDDIAAELATIESSFYTHNGQEIEFFLTEFGEIEPVESDGSIDLAVQISLQHYAPDNLTNPS